MTDDSLPTAALLDGRYQLHECVGQGGMARVYRADDVLLGRTVAIKMLRSEVDGAAAPGGVRRETAALASLNHPALVTLFDAQLVPGRSEYLVMEYVDGPTLSARIAQGPLPAREVAAIAADLSEALHVVHGAGYVHRDVKPSNVLLSQVALPGSRSGAKLADFGISVLVDAARVTSPGVVIGTAAYLAPEQLEGASPAPPADVYSLGLVLLEALTGQPAFAHAEGIGAAMARLIETPDVPAHLDPGWSDLLQRMLARAPGDRPSAAGVFAAVSGLSAGPSLPPRPSVPAAVAAAGYASAAPAAQAADSAAAVAPTPAPTLRLDVPAAEAAPSSRKRRIAVLGGVAVAAAVVTIAIAAFAGGGQVDPSDAPRIVTEQTRAPATVDPVQTDDTEVAVVPVDDTPPAEIVQDDTPPTKDEQKAAEQAARDAEKEQKKAEQEQRKAEEEQRKADERKDREEKKNDD